MSDEKVHASFEEAIREVIREFGGLAEHLLVHPDDAAGEGLEECMDDRTGDIYYLVDGVKVFPTLECPKGTIGALVPDEPIGSA